MIRRSLLFTIMTFLMIPSAFSSERHYCEASSVEITDGYILVHTGEEVVAVDALEVDQGGLYFSEDKVRCLECGKLTQQLTCGRSECPKKQKINPWDPQNKKMNPKHVCEYNLR